MMSGVYRTTSISGIYETDTGEIEFSENFDYSGFYVETTDHANELAQKFFVSDEEMLAIAEMGLISNAFSLSELARSVKETKDNKKTADNSIRKLHEAMNSLSDNDEDEYVSIDGGGTINLDSEYVSIDGWGIIRLDSGDFEVTR